MGYISTVSNLRSKPFVLCDGATAADVRSGFESLVAKASSRAAVEDFYHFFDVEVASNVLDVSLTGNDGKGYYLPEAVRMFVKAVNGFTANSEDPGFFLSFELWGEEPGDAVLYVTQGNDLMAVRGEVTFDNSALVSWNEIK